MNTTLTMEESFMSEITELEHLLIWQIAQDAEIVDLTEDELISEAVN